MEKEGVTLEIQGMLCANRAEFFALHQPYTRRDVYNLNRARL